MLREFWEASLVEENVNVKKMWAVAKVLWCIPMAIRDCRVDVLVDNQSVLHTWMGRGAHSRGLTKVAQRLFQLMTQIKLYVLRPIKQ